jgi:hypothetical protein
VDSESARWDLSAPASQVLLTGASTPNAWAIKLAFKELVLRRGLVLRRERRRRFLLLYREVDTLSLGRWPSAGTEHPLVGVMEAFPKAAIFRSDEGGVPIDVAAREVQRWYRAGGGYVQAEVLPELQRRGYYRLIELERGPEWQLTDAGMQKLTELHALLDTGKTEFPVWLRQDPGRAAAYLTGAGAALLLLGNPVTWLWDLLATVIAGGEVLPDDIPPGGGPPFTTLVEPRTSERDSSAPADGGVPAGDAEKEEDDPDSTGGGGGGGGSPGDTIDSGMGDGDDGGDGGDGE